MELVVNNKEAYLWVERFRPQTIEECIIPDALKAQFKKYLEEGQLPNLLLYSPSPGTGKTTTAKALCNELGIRPLFINASLNNSIDDIRMMVTQYATTVSLIGDSVKVVILDECERLSAAAQDSLKGLIEHVHQNCRFILTCNTKSRVIEPLRSRCIEIDFMYSAEDTKKLGAAMYKRCQEILNEMQVQFNPKVLAAVVMKCVPDNRKILQTLQRYSANGAIDEGVLGMLNGADSKTLIDAMKKKEYGVVKKWCFDNHDRLGDEFYGHLYKSMESDLTDQSVPQAILIINEYQRHHTTVADRFIHFTALVTELMMSIQFKG